MLNLHQLRLFLAVSQLGSFTQAADRLRISQPAISAQVRRLEEDLGIELLWRSGREIGLTEAGEALQGYAQRMLGLCEEALHTMDEYKQMKRGRLRVVATTTPGVYVLPPLLGKFIEENPLLDIEFAIANYSQVLSQLLNYEHDVALICGDFPDHQDLRSIHLADDSLIPVGSPRSVLAQKQSVTPQEFISQRFFVREQGSNTLETVLSRLAYLGLKPECPVSLPNNEAIKQAVAANVGYSILSISAMSEELEQGYLTEIDVPDLRCTMPIWLTYHKSRFVSASIRMFFQALRVDVNA